MPPPDIKGRSDDHRDPRGLPDPTELHRLLDGIADGTSDETKLYAVAELSPAHRTRVALAIVDYAEGQCESFSGSNGLLPVPFLNFAATSTMYFDGDPAPEVRSRLESYAVILLENARIIIQDESVIPFDDEPNTDWESDRLDDEDDGAEISEANSPRVLVSLLIETVEKLSTTLPVKSPNFCSEVEETINLAFNELAKDEVNFQDPDTIGILCSLLTLARDVRPLATFDLLLTTASRVAGYLGISFNIPDDDMPQRFEPLADPRRDLPALFGELLLVIGELQPDLELVPTWHRLIRDCEMDCDWCDATLIGLARAEAEAIRQYLPVLYRAATEGAAEAVRVLGRLIDVSEAAAVIADPEHRPANYNRVLTALEIAVRSEDLDLSSTARRNLSVMLRNAGLQPLPED